MRTAQELFDTTVINLLKQDEACMNEKLTCVYSNGYGLKCAVGWLIPDAEYDKSMEGLPVDELITGGALTSERTAEFRSNEDLLYSLQAVHDNFSVAKWPERFRDVAKEFCLIYHAE